MKEFVEYILKNLVDAPEDVNVNCCQGDDGMIVEIRVNPMDVGKIVGRRGNIIKSLRTISTMICARFGHRVRLEIIE